MTHIVIKEVFLAVSKKKFSTNENSNYPCSKAGTIMALWLSNKRFDNRGVVVQEYYIPAATLLSNTLERNRYSTKKIEC